MPRSVIAFCIASVVASSLAAPSARAQSVVRYEPPEKDLKFVYATVPPVATPQPGDMLETRTVDAFGGVIQKAGRHDGHREGRQPLTGPFYDRRRANQATRWSSRFSSSGRLPQGVGALAPGFGALNKTDYTPMLNPTCRSASGSTTSTSTTQQATFKATDSGFTVKIPLHPFLGCIGVAPAGGEARSSIVPARIRRQHGSPRGASGHTLYLPVNAPGALLYLGDGHAAQGEGEVAGTGIEVPLRVRLQVDVIKGKKICLAAVRERQSIMAAGAYRPLDDALRIAFSELVDWIHDDYGLSKLDAYELLSKVARIDLTEMVDPNYVVIARIDKKYLPAR